MDEIPGRRHSEPNPLMKTNIPLIISLDRKASLLTPLALLWCLAVSSLIPAHGANTFANTGPLVTARQNHTATLLPNGKVLVAGGDDGSRLASAELYDPASGSWTATNPLAAVRYEHTATLLPNGKILVAGGFGNGGSVLASAELYDPASGSWTA